MFYNDSTVADYLTRTRGDTYPTGGSQGVIEWGGRWGIFPGMLFMWSSLQGVVDPFDFTAPVPPTPGTAINIPQSEMSVFSVSSQETVLEDSPGTRILDGNIFTHWHTDYDNFTNTGEPYPHEIVIDLGKEFTLSEVSLVNRQGHPNGVVEDIEIYIGADGTTWGAASELATLVCSANTQAVAIFPTVAGRFVRVRMLSSVNGNVYGALAEFNAVGIPTIVGTPTVAVPDLVGDTGTVALADLATAELQAGTVTSVNQPTIAAEIVISQSPVAPTGVNVGSNANSLKALCSV